MKTSKKGISLIVLVITIIVMIVLAAAIILSLQSSGIIGRANEAKAASDVANAKQVVAMANAEWQLHEEKIKSENPGITTFKQYAESKLEAAGYKVGIDKDITVSKDGAVNIVYIGEDNRKAIIPEGFTVSTDSKEDTVTEGLVIKDSAGNEFVWVPVEYTKSTDDDQNGYDDNFEAVFVTTDSSYTEPYSTGSYTEEEIEYNKMKASVQENRGFYIARYEAGLPEGKTTSNVTTGDLPISKKGADVWNKIAWGDDMDVIGTNGAVYRARQMYKGSNSVVSTLCYGVQWDAVMNFMSDVKNINDESKLYINDSTGMGWYSDNYSEGNPNHKTGTDVGDKASNMVKNIYDMAGNVCEWTMEAGCSTDSRIFRGGCWRDLVAYGPASGRGSRYPVSFASAYYGFRPALYLK